jgi:HK97 family phage portal protein
VARFTRARLLGRNPRPEQRAISTFPFDVGPSIYGGATVDAGSALTLAPVYASVRLLADSVASLPLQLYRKNPDGTREKLSSPSIFDQPAATGTLYDWLHALMTSLTLQGNAYGYITDWDGFGYPTGIEWLPTAKMYVDEPKSGVTRTTAEYYLDGKQLPNERIFHVRAFTQPGCTKGLSPIAAFALLINSGIQTAQYGESWFTTGGFPPGTFKNTQRTVPVEDADAIKARLVSSMRKRQPLVYGSDWDYTPIMVPPSEAQFIEAMRMNATQVAAIYGIPPERIGGDRGSSLTYTTREQEDIAFLNSTLRPWLVRLEQAFFRILPERRYVRFNVDAMFRTDLKTRHDVYKVDREIGLHNLDEIRELEDLPPLPKGQGKEYLPEPAKPAPADPMADPNAPPQPTPLLRPTKAG